MTTLSDPTIPGEDLRTLDRKIDQLESLLEHLDSKEHKPKHMYEESETQMLWRGIREQTISRLQGFRDERVRHLEKHPAPSVIVCPHCGYDGEFDVEKGKTTGIGFRMLQPILEPRWIVDYKDGKMWMSDPCDRYDPFDLIAEPGFVACLDRNPESDPVQAELRDTLRGRWVLCCGNEECLMYFDARPFINTVNFEYDIFDHHNLHKWGRR